MIRSDAWDGKTGTHALTLKVELMHEAEKQGRQHHFLPLSRPAPTHVGAAPPTKPYPTAGPRQQGARIPPGVSPCWRRPAGNPLSHRRATPTGNPDSRSPPTHVGAAPPATPYPTVGSRQQGAPNPARRRPMLAPPRRQSLSPPLGHANRAPRIPLAAGPCWRRPAGKALIHRRATPTGRPESRPAPAHVGAAPPATLYPTAGPRQQDAPNPARRQPMLAPPRRQRLTPPSGHANRACSSPEGPLLPGGPAPLPRRAPTGGPFCRPVQIEI